MFRTVFAAYRAAFAGLSRECWMLALIGFVNRSGSMVLPFLALYLTRERGLSKAEAGQLLSVYGVGSMIGSYLGGRLSDALTPRTIQIASLFGAGVMFILLGQLENPKAIGVALFFTAMTADALRPANMAATAASVAPELRTRAFALHRLAINLGVSIGPALGGFLAVRDYGLLFIVDGGTWLAAGVLMVLLLGPSRPRAVSNAGQPTASPWRDSVFLMFLFFGFVAALVFFQLEASFPLYLNERYGLPEDRIGLMYTVNTILIVVLEMLLVHRVQAWPHLKTIALGVVLTGVGFGLMPWGSTMSFAVFTVVIWTFGEMLSSPIMTAFASERATDANRGRYMGLFTITFSFGFVLAPMVGTWIYEGWGGDFVWHVAIAISLIAASGFMLVDRFLVSAPRPAPSAAAEQ